MNRPKPPVDMLDPWCWACGAEDGDFDEAVQDHAMVMLCEPHDARFAMCHGAQWFYSLCLTGRRPIKYGPPRAGWFLGMRTPSVMFTALRY